MLLAKKKKKVNPKKKQNGYYIIIYIFNVFERSILCSPRLNFLDWKYSQNSNIVKYDYSFKFSIWIYFAIFLIRNVSWAIILLYYKVWNN